MRFKERYIIMIRFAPSNYQAFTKEFFFLCQRPKKREKEKFVAN